MTLRRATRDSKPAGGTVIIVGDVTKDAISSALESTLGAWIKAGRSVPRSPTDRSKRDLAVDYPGSAQSVIHSCARPLVLTRLTSFQRLSSIVPSRGLYGRSI